MARAWLTVGALFLAGVAAGAPVPEGAEAARPKGAPALRVLVAASTAGREFQFFVNLLVGEREAKKADVGVHLQPLPGTKGAGVFISNLPPGKVLKKFPDDLKKYDVLVAFDLDWGRLTDAQLKAVSSWITKDGGGLVVIAAPFHTPRLAGDRGKLRPIRELLPVVLADAKADKRDTTQPWKLGFPVVKGRPAYLKLDAKGKEALAGWETFFRDGKVGPAKKGELTENGFYSCYPVRSVRPGAVVLATFSDPKARLENGKDRPYLATMHTGKGRVTYLGSGELWRVRRYREEFYARFWLGLLADLGKRWASALTKTGRGGLS